MTPESTLEDAAQLMIDHDCGAIPVVDSLGDLRPVGIITDRDIACRAVAEGLDSSELTVRDCMSEPVISLPSAATAEEAVHLLEEHQLRRVVVVDDRGRLCGIVSQADVALKDEAEAGQLLREVSEPSAAPSLQ